MYRVKSYTHCCGSMRGISCFHTVRVTTHAPNRSRYRACAWPGKIPSPRCSSQRNKKRGSSISTPPTPRQPPTRHPRIGSARCDPADTTGKVPLRARSSSRPPTATHWRRTRTTSGRPPPNVIHHAADGGPDPRVAVLPEPAQGARAGPARWVFLLPGQPSTSEGERRRLFSFSLSLPPSLPPTLVSACLVALSCFVATRGQAELTRVPFFLLCRKPNCRH